MSFAVGDAVESVRTGQRRVVARVTPPGAMGTAESHGPTFHMSLLDDDGQARVGGHVLAVWSGSMSSPTRDWVKIDPTIEHVDYPHEPGRLFDCPACDARCYCSADTAECVYEGAHRDVR